MLTDIATKGSIEIEQKSCYPNLMRFGPVYTSRDRVMTFNHQNIVRLFSQIQDYIKDYLSNEQDCIENSQKSSNDSF